MAEYDFLDVVALAEQQIGRPVHAAVILRPTPMRGGGIIGLIIEVISTFKRRTGWFPERALFVVDSKNVTMFEMRLGMRNWQAPMLKKAWPREQVTVTALGHGDRRAVSVPNEPTVDTEIAPRNEMGPSLVELLRP